MQPATSSRILVVGGHTRNIGKTALIVDLIRAFPEAAWTAGKITQFGHGVCSRGGGGCDCAPDEHTVALDWESDPSTGTDSARFLAAHMIDVRGAGCCNLRRSMFFRGFGFVAGIHGRGRQFVELRN